MNSPRLKIAILDCTKAIYNEQMSETMALGGIERCVVSLSRVLSDKGHEVQVFAQKEAISFYKNIRWVSKSEPTPFKADIVIACNDPKLFDQYAQNANHKKFKSFLWHHNPVSFGKTLKKGRIWPLLKWKPVNVFLSKYHLNDYPKFLPSYKNVIIHHGIEDSVLNFPAKSALPEPHAAFISQSYRGLDNVLTIWKDLIYPKNTAAKLFIYSSYNGNDAELQKFGISIVGRLPRNELLAELSTKRVMLIPGHLDETFCLSAIESQCLGLPLVSFGIGALAERIQNGKDGYLVQSNEEFAEKTLLLLENDGIWTDMSRTTATHKLNASWANKAADWENLFSEQKNG